MPTRCRTFEGMLRNDKRGFYLQLASGDNYRLICDECVNWLVGTLVLVTGVVTETDAVLVFSIERMGP
jgi:hypothetical protein